MADGQLFVPGELLSAAEIRRLVEAAHPGARLLPDDAGRARGAGPARYWRLEGGEPPGAGSERLVGIISAMTEHFCETCNRVRLSAAGALHTCLAYDDAVDLRALLARGGPDAVVDTIRRAVGQKRDGHSFQLIGIGGPRKAMVQIGG
jgi:cyclic pyranopterin phosphate synthase